MRTNGVGRFIFASNGRSLVTGKELATFQLFLFPFNIKYYPIDTCFSIGSMHFGGVMFGYGMKYYGGGTLKRCNLPQSSQSNLLCLGRLFPPLKIPDLANPIIIITIYQRIIIYIYIQFIIITLFPILSHEKR